VYSMSLNCIQQLQITVRWALPRASRVHTCVQRYSLRDSTAVCACAQVSSAFEISVRPYRQSVSSKESECKSVTVPLCAMCSAAELF
jgi:hypothetical protein